jgi:LuxR family transcriptional regulator, maltose regulon positive regulatory protein
LVRFLIERGPPFVHLVVLTRADPPLPLARLRAHGRLVEVRADDLRCNSQEASAYLAAAGASLAPELVERLLDRTEGWIAGLQLAAISLRDRHDAAALIEDFHVGQHLNRPTIAMSRCQKARGAGGSVITAGGSIITDSLS